MDLKESGEMIYYDNQFKLVPFKAKYMQNEKEQENYVVNKEDIQAYEDMGHINELSITEAIYEESVIERLEEVKDYPESEFNTVSEYVLNGNVLKGTPLESKKQNELLEGSLLELTSIIMGGMTS